MADHRVHWTDVPRASRDWRVTLILAVTFMFTLMLICGTILTLAGAA